MLCFLGLDVALLETNPNGLEAISSASVLTKFESCEMANRLTLMIIKRSLLDTI